MEDEIFSIDNFRVCGIITRNWNLRLFLSLCLSLSCDDAAALSLCKLSNVGAGSQKALVKGAAVFASILGCQNRPLKGSDLDCGDNCCQTMPNGRIFLILANLPNGRALWAVL